MGREANSAVIRVHKNKNYTVMSNEHLLFAKPPMSLKAKGLLSMFLALPPDWNYSISGISSLCKESRDCIRATMEELKKHGYFYIEKQNGENGRFIYIYHIFEQAKNRLPDIENPHLEDPPLEDPNMDVPDMEKATQLNIKEININEQIIKKITTEELFNLYKKICISYPQPQELNTERIKKAAARLKKHPDKNYWQTVFEKAEKSDICQKYTFINFDWLIKNNTNAQKVYEGNYDNKKDNQFRSPSNNEKYVNYHSRQGEM